MTYLSRFTICAVLLLGVSTAPAASIAPNVQVNVRQGRTKIFTGITDASGRFTTTAMEPGVYTFELRALKTAPPAQYFLLLSGAKPVSAPMADKKAVLTMDAQVRRPRSVTGQVTARRLRIVAPAAPSSSINQSAALPSAPTPAATPTAVLSRSQAVAVSRTAAPARVAVPARIVARSNAGALAPAPARGAAAMRATAPVSPTPASGLVPRPAGDGQRIINGVPHVWTPIAPGSTLGRWVPGRR